MKHNLFSLIVIIIFLAVPLVCLSDNSLLPSIKNNPLKSSQFYTPIKKKYDLAIKKIEPQQKKIKQLELIPPLILEKNIGQTNAQVKYLLRQKDSIFYFTDDEFVSVINGSQLNSQTGEIISKPPQILRMALVNSKPSKVVGTKVLKTTVHQYLGVNKKNWIKNIPSFSQLHYDNVYDGIDMKWDTNDHHLNYQFIVSSTASEKKIKLRFKGANKVSINHKGQLEIQLKNGNIYHSTPRFYELNSLKETRNKRKEIKGHFILNGKNEVGFVVDKRTMGRILIIDPYIDVIKFFVNNPDSIIISHAADIIKTGFHMVKNYQSNLFISGTTMTPEFPVTNETMLRGLSDAFVIRMELPTLIGPPQPIYMTYIGGTNSELNAIVATGESNEVYLGGTTSSFDFPTPGTSYRDSSTAQASRIGYIARLSETGSLISGSMLGSGSEHFINDVKFETHNERGYSSGVFVAGTAKEIRNGEDINGEATENVIQNYTKSNHEGFVAKINANLSELMYFTYLGGVSFDSILALDVNNHKAVVAGTTASIDFRTTTESAQPFHSKDRPNPADPAECRYTMGRGFQVPEALYKCFDGFVVELNEMASAINHGTFYSLSEAYTDNIDSVDYIRDIYLDQNSHIFITGGSQRVNNDSPPTVLSNHFFTAKLTADASNYEFNTFRNFGLGDSGASILTDAVGTIHITGTISEDGHDVGESTALNPSDSLNFHQLTGRADAFYMTLEPQNGQITYFVYLGGEGRDTGQDIIVHNQCAYPLVKLDASPVDPVASFNNPDLGLYQICNEGQIPGSFTKTVSADTENPMSPGGQLSFIITINNRSTSTALTADITDHVPYPLVVSNVEPASECLIDNIDNNLVTCSDFVIEARQTRTITITVNLPADTFNNSDCLLDTNNTATIQGIDFGPFSDSATVRFNCPNDSTGIEENDEPETTLLDKDELCNHSDECRGDLVCGTISRNGGQHMVSDNCLFNLCQPNENCWFKLCWGDGDGVIQPHPTCINENQADNVFN